VRIVRAEQNSGMENVMRKQKRQSPAKRFRRFVVPAIVVAAILAITAVTVISRQDRAARAAAAEPVTAPGATSSRTYVTRRIGGQDILIDSQTGETKPLTPQEAQKLAEGLAPMLDNSADGLVKVRHADGSVSMDLEGRFQNVTVARVSSDGTIEQSCVDNPRDAAKFFGINPELIEKASTSRKKVNLNQQ
jgi:hypothetical protein